VNEPLLTIGAFARAVGLTPSALRHYDECGLLPPAEVDDTTGYRYYTPDLSRRAALVAGMRDAGVPIETMRAVLDGDPEGARRALTDFVEELTTRSARAETAVSQVLAAVSRGPASGDAARVTVSGPVLAAALRQVRPAADVDPASPLTSVLLDLQAGRLDVVATNRYWMAVRTLDVVGTGTGRAVLALSRVADLAVRLDRVAEVTVELGETAFVDGTELGTREVAYPAHRMVLDGLDEPRTHAVLDRQELAAAAEEAGRSEVRLCLDGRASVRAGEGAAAVAGAVRGEPVEVRLRQALLLRALGSALGPEVAIEVAGVHRPVRVWSPYQQGFLAVLMPIGPA
jgi:DNA-binding transcriptional MerR regulator